MIKNYILSTSFLLMACGCVSTPETGNNDTPITRPDTPQPNQRCLAHEPKDVHMWINAMPNPGASGRPPLRTTFKAMTGTPGYQFALKVNRVMESFPEQVVLDLIVTKPTGIVTQVVTENKVNIKLDNFPGSEGSTVQVNCGGVPFFKVDKVLVVF